MPLSSSMDDPYPRDHVSKWACGCCAVCTGPDDARHDRARMYANTGGMPGDYPKRLGDVDIAYPTFYQYPPSTFHLPEMSCPRHLRNDESTRFLLEVTQATAESLRQMAWVYSMDPSQCQAISAMLKAKSEAMLSGMLSAPAEIGEAGRDTAEHGRDIALRYFAACKVVVAWMAETQRQFAAPDPNLQLFIQVILAWGSEDPKDAIIPLERSFRFLSNDDAFNDDEAPGGDDRPARPGPSVLQPSGNATEEPMKSMATVPTRASRTITIGTGTEAIDHFDVRHLGVEGVESVKVLHPLQQANLAKHQSPMLADLRMSLFARARRGRYGFSGPQLEAVSKSMYALGSELSRRGIKPSASEYGRSRSSARRAPETSFSTQGNAGSFYCRDSVTERRMPSMGGQGSFTGRQPSSMGLRTSSVGGRVPSTRGYSQYEPPHYAPTTTTTTTTRQLPYNTGSSRSGSHTGQFGATPSLTSNALRQFSEQYKQPTFRPSSYYGETTPSKAPPNYFEEQPQVGSGSMVRTYHSHNGLVYDLFLPLAITDLPGILKEEDIRELRDTLERCIQRVRVEDLVKRGVAARYRTLIESLAVVEEWLAKEQLEKDAMVALFEVPGSECLGGEGDGANDDDSAAPRSALRDPEVSAKAKVKRSVSFQEDNDNDNDFVVYTQGNSSSRLRPFMEERSSKSDVAAFNGATIVETLEAQREAEATDRKRAYATNMDANIKEWLKVPTDKLSNAADSGSDVGDLKDLASESTGSDEKDDGADTAPAKQDEVFDEAISAAALAHEHATPADEGETKGDIEH